MKQNIQEKQMQGGTFIYQELIEWSKVSLMTEESKSEAYLLMSGLYLFIYLFFIFFLHLDCKCKL